VKKVFLILSLFFLISLSSAITCDKQIISNSWINGQVPSNSTLSCQSSSPVTINSIGTYFTVSPSLPFILNNSNQTFTISYQSTAPIGSGIGLIDFDDSTASVILNFSVLAQSVQPECNLGASLTSLTQAIQQNSQYAIPKITFSPTNCQGSLILDSSHVRVTGGVIIGGLQKPVSISSIVSDGVNLAIDTTSLNKQTYLNNLEINAFGKTFQIPINIVVTSGSSDSTVFDCSNIPTCSVTNTQLSLNSSYSMVCTNLVPDVTIVPVIDDNYIQGKNVDTSQNQYIWYFTPIQMGNTQIKAKFYYQNAPVCSNYAQDVRITSSGSVIAGTNLAFLFTPSLSQAQVNQNVIVQLVDNKTGSLVNNPEIQVDAVPLVLNGSTYYFKFDSGRNYTFRGRSQGYDDLVQSLYLQSRPINISLSPSSGDSSTFFVINNPSSAILFLNGVKIDSNYSGSFPQGNNTIKAIKEGYTDTELDFYIDLSPYASLNSVWEKGTLASISLNKNMSWTVNYLQTISSQSELLLSGNNQSISFTPNKVGIYNIKDSTGKVLWTNEIKGWDGKILGFNWLWWIGGIVFLFLIYLYFKNKSSSNQGMFAGSTNLN
jgi:hypothetical protein